MPGLDRRGPMGAGPMTGGRRGLCGSAASPYAIPASGGMGYGRGLGMRRGIGAGFGPGRGGGRGFGRRYAENPGFYMNDYPQSRTQEMEMLKADADAMQASLAAVQKRITELENENQQ